MHGFIKVSNSIFNYKLKPKAFFIYIYLTSRVNCLQSTTATYAHLSQACNMDSKTVQTAIKELEAKSLVTKSNRYNTRGFIANRYYVTNLISDNKGWFKLSREVFKTDIKAHDFIVYCFICKCMNSKYQEAYPSIDKLCNGTGISRSRVCKAIKYLHSYTFINRIKRHYRRTKAYRHNRYLKFKCNIKKCKKNARAKARTQIYKHIILLPSRKVNYYFQI